MAVSSIFLCSIVEAFEAIAENLVYQEHFTRIEVIGDDVTLVGERVGGFSCHSLHNITYTVVSTV